MRNVFFFILCFCLVSVSRISLKVNSAVGFSHALSHRKASLQFRRCFQTFSVTETSEPLCTPLFFMSPSCGCKMPLQPVLCVFLPAGMACEWPGWAQPCCQDVIFGLCAQCTGLLQTGTGGPFSHGNPRWGPVTNPGFWMFFLDIFESALGVLWKALCASESVQMR